MANYLCDFIPHLPASVGFIPPNGLHPQRSYAVVGGSLPHICNDWEIVVLEPEPSTDMFEGTATLIADFLQQRRLTVRAISRSGIGAALVRFMDVVEQVSAVFNSPYFIGDTIMRVIEQNRGRNHRSAGFTHDVWLMLMNY